MGISAHATERVRRTRTLHNVMRPSLVQRQAAGPTLHLAAESPAGTYNKPPPWTPPPWSGMLLSSWLRLLARNRFAVGLTRLPMACRVTVATACNTLLACVQEGKYGRKIAATEINEPPLFILGHWRTGTTFLHELLALDERHSFATTYDCFAPYHSLLTGGVVMRWLQFALPSKRPMDNMALGWGRPQEDEYAYCALGMPSPYLTIAFPNNPPQSEEYADFDGLSPADVERWKNGFVRFLKQLTFRDRRRLVLKSPLHTCRIKTLLELFPDARFVHLVRDPYAVFSSTVKTWRVLYRVHGLQRPTCQNLEEYVLRIFERMYRVFAQQRELVPPSQFCEVRYEELVQDPIGQLRAVYQRLNLGGFEQLLSKAASYLESMADYRPDRYQLSAQTRAVIGQRWGWYLREYGYPAEA